MKFLYDFGKSQTSDSAPSEDTSVSGGQAAESLTEDEITDEALLEAIAGTSNPNCQLAGGNQRSPNGQTQNLIHRHKYR